MLVIKTLILIAILTTVVLCCLQLHTIIRAQNSWTKLFILYSIQESYCLRVLTYTRLQPLNIPLNRQTNLTHAGTLFFLYYLCYILRNKSTRKSSKNSHLRGEDALKETRPTCFFIKFTRGVKAATYSRTHIFTIAHRLMASR